MMAEESKIENAKMTNLTLIKYSSVLSCPLNFDTDMNEILLHPIKSN